MICDVGAGLFRVTASAAAELRPRSRGALRFLGSASPRAAALPRLVIEASGRSRSAVAAFRGRRCSTVGPVQPEADAAAGAEAPHPVAERRSTVSRRLPAPSGAGDVVAERGWR